MSQGERGRRAGRGSPAAFVAAREAALEPSDFLLRIGGLVKLALADDRAVVRRDLVAAFELDLFLFAFVDLGDADDMLVVGDAEDGDALVLRPAIRMSPTVVRIILPWSVTSISCSPWWAGKLATTQPLRSDVSMLVMPWPPRLVRRYS